MSKKMITMGDAEKELIKLLGEDTVFLDGDLRFLQEKDH